jgi:hypothetical protein
VLEIAQQVADVPLEAANAGHLAYGLALRPAAQGNELAPTACPAPVPETPLRTLQGANCVVGAGRVSRARAKAASLAVSAAVSCFASSSLSPRSAKPASSPRSMRATSVSVVTPGRSSATSFTRHTSFGTSPPSSREPGT